MQEISSFLKSRQPVNLILIVINIIAFVVLSVTGDTEDTYFMFLHGANYTPAVLYEKEYYRVFSCMFLHFGLEHLFYNMRRREKRLKPPCFSSLLHPAQLHFAVDRVQHRLFVG